MEMCSKQNVSGVDSCAGDHSTRTAGSSSPISSPLKHQFPEGEETLKKGIAASGPNAHRLRWKLAENLIRQDRPDEAEKELFALQRDHPGSPLASLGLADLAKARGDREGQRQHALEALRRPAEGGRWIPFEAAVRLMDIPSGRPAAANALRGLVREMPKEPLPRLILGVLLEDDAPYESREHLTLTAEMWMTEDFEQSVAEFRELLGRVAG